MYTKIFKPHTCSSANLFVVYFFFGALLTLISCNTPAEDHYGFIARLGNDTVSVESITRQGNTVTSDEVDRFPRVHVRHTVIKLNQNGSIAHLVMDIYTPSEPANERERKVIADVANNKVHLSKTDSTGTVNRDFSDDGSIVVAHVPQMYSLYELYFAAALKRATTEKLAPGTTVDMRQFYIDREFDRFPLGRAHVKLLDKNKMEVTHDWLSGTGEAVMDSNNNMISYSGERTTYKVDVTRLATPPDVKGIANRFEALETKSGIVRQLSVRDTVHVQIGKAIFTIDYGRPLMRGRNLLGDVIPYDRVWRTGANAATQFTTSAPVKLAGMNLSAGTYTLWTVPHKDGADLIVNRQSGQWGTEYNSARNLGTARMSTQTLQSPVEEFTISITAKDMKHRTLVMEWGSFKWTAPIEVQ